MKGYSKPLPVANSVWDIEVSKVYAVRWGIGVTTCDIVYSGGRRNMRAQ
jgi:hypothetical protein